MPDLIVLLNNHPALELPSGWLGWGEWLAFLGVIAWMQRSWWEFNQPLVTWRLRTLVLLTILVPLTSLMIPAIAIDLPPADLGPGPTSLPLTVFAAIPWFLAAGFIGPASAGVLAAVSGLLIALWGTQNAFLPLELAGLASVLSWMMHQSYRTSFFRLLRHPFLASLLITVVLPFLLFIDALLTAPGDLAYRIEYGLSHLVAQGIAQGGSILIAGLVSEAFALIAAKKWGAQQAVDPSPAESKLTGRFLYVIFPVALILLITLVIGDWIVAGQAAQAMLRGRMDSAGRMTVGGIPSFSGTGKELIKDLVVDTRYEAMGTDEIKEALDIDILRVPYFSQLIYLDPQGRYIASQPEDALIKLPLSSEEWTAIDNAENFPFDTFPISPEPGGETAILSYIAGIFDSNDSLTGVLIGRSDLSENPYANSLILGLKSLENIGGKGILIDEHDTILYHPDSSLIMTTYFDRLDDQTNFYSELLSSGIRQWVYYESAPGRTWGVIFTVPAQYVQRQAVFIAIPLVAIVGILTLIAVILIQFSLKTVTASLQRLTVEADRMAHGELNRPMIVEGEDEVGQLGWAFEQMRASLKSRLDELNRLLHVSQGVASTLELEASLKPVLESALVNGATASRVVLEPSLLPNLNGSLAARVNLGYGPAGERFANLDEQILSLTRRQDVVKLTSLTRPRLFSMPADTPRPGAILAIALRHENLFYGALWTAFEQSRQFSAEEVRYLSTLAGQAALAVANARLFLTAEIGRLRLEAILTSTPDPVLVTDQHDNLLLTNPAARNVLNLHMGSSVGKPIEEVITHKDLITLLKSKSADQQSAEITFSDGRVYLATTSTMFSDENWVGRVCILRDVTSFKKLDTMKSDFVSTVSHDLRSPLTLIQGYASMLPKVGDLNDQQKNYLRKINQETEKISRLVHNVLNLGRIESGIGLQLEEKSINEIIERVINSLQARAAQKRIQLVVEATQDDSPAIEADQDLLHQAMFNLVENGIKFTEADGKVVVSAQVDQEQVIFTVSDTGTGISPTDQKRLFEKYFLTSRKGTQFDGGSGLGLAIVKSIVDRHDGRVWVESQLGKGSKFHLAIPLRQKKA